jgi:carboxylesterase type B
MSSLWSGHRPRLKLTAGLAALAAAVVLAPSAAGSAAPHTRSLSLRAPSATSLPAGSPVTLPMGAQRDPSSPPGSQGLIVTTGKGMVEGRSTSGNVNEFLGIPYAAPPVGRLRWQPPQPARAWVGVRPALSYGNRCPQLASGNGPRADTEDCLYLNVYTPADTAPGQKLPVLFMIHGGGLVNGAGDQHDGSLIVSTDHIVVVSVNYRLGVFGFLSVPGLTAPAWRDGNFGLLDQEAALRWVRRNIAAFGGDPGDVTIAGESAGGYSVCALLTSPPAAGLFAKAIMESGSCASQPLSAAEKSSLAFAAKAGCGNPSAAAACLRAKPESTLLDASAGISGTVFTVGGQDLPVAPAQAVASGRFTKVPIIIGTNHDEGRTFAQGFASYTRQQYQQFVTANYGSLAAQVLAHYPFGNYPRPYTGSYAIGAIWTDSGYVAGIGGCPEQNLAAQFAASGTPTYFYQFDDRHAPGLNDNLPGYQWGAGHAMELAYLWPSFNNGYSLYALLTPAQLELSHEMAEYWGTFAKTGSPDVRGQARWPQYQAGRLMSLREGHASRAISAATFAREHQCSFWNGPGAGYEG